MVSALAGIAFHFVVAGGPVTAQYLVDDRPACERRNLALHEMQSSGIAHFVSQVGGWCTVAGIDRGRWIAEQWREISTQGSSSTGARIRSEGWRVNAPIAMFRTSVTPGGWVVSFPDLRADIQVLSPQGVSVTQAHKALINKALGEAAQVNPKQVFSAGHGAPFLISRAVVGDRPTTVVSGTDAVGRTYGVILRESKR